MYGGLDVEDIHNRKGLTARQKILDYMGSTELIANLFRISQTEEKLRKDKVEGAETATKVHYSVGKEVRSAIEKNWWHYAGRFACSGEKHSTDRKRTNEASKG